MPLTCHNPGTSHRLIYTFHCQSPLVLIYCYFCIPFWSGWCFLMFCHLFWMPDICEAHAMCQHISILEACFCIFVGYLCHCNLVFLSFPYQTLFFSFLASSIALCSLCFYPPGPTPDHLLFHWSFITVNSFLILVIISSLLNPLMNCSIGLLSLSLHSYSFALTFRQPIYSSAFSFPSLTSLLHWIDNIVSLPWGLNFSHITSNRLDLVLHFSFSLSVSVWTNLSPLQLSQFMIIGTFSLSALLWLFVINDLYFNLEFIQIVICS